MEQKPKSRNRYAFPYMLLGLLIAFVLVALASVLYLVYEGQPITVNNLLMLHTTLVFLYVDLLGLYSAVIFGLVGYQKDRAADARRYAEWSMQNQRNETVQATEAQTEKEKKYQAEITRLNDQNLNQKNTFQELETIIHRGKQQWEATFDALDDLIILTDDKGSIIRCNRATGTVFHLGFNQIIGRGIDELFANDVISLRGTIPGEKKELKLTRSEIWYEVSKSYLLIDGKQEGWVYIFRNITPQKHAFRDQQRLTQYYEILVNNSPVAIVTLNQEGRVIDCNPAFESLFQYNKKEAIGSKVDTLITPSHLAIEADGMGDAVRKGIKIQSITQRLRKDGSIVDVEVYGIPVVISGKQVGSLGLYHDISNLVKTHKTAPMAAALATKEISGMPEPIPQAEVEREEIPILDQAVVGEQPSAEVSLPVEAEPAPQPETAPEAEPQAAVGPQLAAVPEAEPLAAPETQAQAAPGAQLETALEPEPRAAPVPQPQPAKRPAAARKHPRRRSIPVEKIEGIGPVYARKLAEAGIKTTDELLEFGKSRKGREELVAKTGISALLVLKWANSADLMRIKGVGEEYSELLERAGVDTVKELRNRNPKNLLEAIAQANEAHKLVRRLPTLADVESWVKEAKETEPVMTY